MKNLFFFAVLLYGAGSVSAQSIPMSKGATWIYNVTVRYMKEDTQAVKTFTARMKVIDTVAGSNGYSVALITGNPQQYAFYEEGAKYNSRDALIKSPEGKYYLVDFPGKKFKQLLNGDMNKLLKDELPFYSERLNKGDVLCQIGEDSCAAKFHWSCTDILQYTPTVKAFDMRNWDNTGSENWRITSNFGFENYSYEHNGTLASVKAVLKQFQR